MRELILGPGYPAIGGTSLSNRSLLLGIEAQPRWSRQGTQKNPPGYPAKQKSSPFLSKTRGQQLAWKWGEAKGQRPTQPARD